MQFPADRALTFLLMMGFKSELTKFLYKVSRYFGPSRFLKLLFPTNGCVNPLSFMYSRNYALNMSSRSSWYLRHQPDDVITVILWSYI